jgi:Caspase domain
MGELRAGRRRWIAQAGALVSAAALPGFAAGAAEPQSTLNVLPRVGLVIGNARYVDVPLRNSVNDAKAISDALLKLGFRVDLQLDAGRTEMLEAIARFTGQLAKSRSVGLFYYAGHGAQLDWRNYLIPVEAEVGTLDDVQTHAVALTVLLDGLVNARNPMNVIILDACRDNPFGSKAILQQKGLSQFDAPPGSLLAYATAPGNTASDGPGANGLYTENLLREIRTPEAKIEDVFKRVRLNVRRQSRGQQVPWESTSLEEDFYFLPPAKVTKLSEEELRKRDDEERTLWEAARAARTPAALEEFLRRYPSGGFSELAQFQLDRILALQGEKKVEVVSVAANPFSKGTARASASFNIGDVYTYRVVEAFSRVETARMTETVTSLNDEWVIYNDGELVTDYLGNVVNDLSQQRFSASQMFVSEYSVGKRWTAGILLTRAHGAAGDVDFSFRVSGKESITVPAGSFDAFKVEGRGNLGRRGIDGKFTYWIAPDQVRRALAMEYFARGRGGRYQSADRFELVTYQQG